MLSKRAVKLLREFSLNEARRTGCSAVSPEHLVLAMITREWGLGFEVLKHLKINTMTMRLALEQNISSFADWIVLDEKEIKHSLRMKMMETKAESEAVLLANNYVGTEHFLLAAASEKESVVAFYFEKVRLDMFLLREAVREVQKKKSSSALEEGGRFSDIFGRQASKVFHVKDKGEREQKSAAEGRGESGAKKLFLDAYCIDMVRQAGRASFQNVIGREKEIARIIELLSRKTKNNPVLVGEAGVGKTSIVESLSYKIAKKEVPFPLMGKRILSLDIGSLVAGTKFRGEFEERMKKLLKDTKENPEIILFIDELHTLIGAGGSEGALDASNLIKPALSRGELQIIGATTAKEYTRYIEKEIALSRRFQKVKIEEPSFSESVEILRGVKKMYEDFHLVKYDDEVISEAVKLSSRYIHERALPDKAIDILDEAGARCKIRSFSIDGEYGEKVKEIKGEIAKLASEKRESVKRQSYEEAALLRDKIGALEEAAEDARRSFFDARERERPLVTLSDVRDIVGEIAGIPSERLAEAEEARLINMENILHESIVAQNDAVSAVSRALRRSRSGISSKNRPIASFVFMGPTGVGKTEVAKALSAFMFGSREKIIRIDMSDYMEKHHTSRLVGAPPGYVGFEDGGVLTDKVRQNPYSLVLLDEIEKANPSVFNLLLQILEEGELMDSAGRAVDFRNTVIIMTSNVGSREMSEAGRVGFSSGENFASGMKESAVEELKKLFTPEIFNRIDEAVVFEPLKKEDVRKILQLMLDELSERLKERKLTMSLTREAEDILLVRGFDKNLGARQMRREVERDIEDEIASLIISGEVGEGDEVRIDAKEGELKFEVKKPQSEEERAVVCKVGDEAVKLNGEIFE